MERKTKRAPPRGLVSEAVRRHSDGPDVGSLLALRTLDDVELHRLAFGQCSIAVSSDRAVVDEDIIAIRTSDEAIPLLVAEPLHRSLAQPVPPCTTPDPSTPSGRRERSMGPNSRATNRRGRLRYSFGGIWSRTLAICIAAMPASHPLLPCLPPARSNAWSRVSVARTPNSTGTPVS